MFKPEDFQNSVSENMSNEDLELLAITANGKLDDIKGSPLNHLSREIHQAQIDKGFYHTLRTPLETYMLITGEIAEAADQVCRGKPEYYKDGNKPEGEAVEVVDALIRILDYAGFRGWDLDKLVEEKLTFNKTRPYKHGKVL